MCLFSCCIPEFIWHDFFDNSVCVFSKKPLLAVKENGMSINTSSIGFYMHARITMFCQIELLPSRLWTLVRSHIFAGDIHFSLPFLNTTQYRLNLKWTIGTMDFLFFHLTCTNQLRSCVGFWFSFTSPRVGLRGCFGPQCWKNYMHNSVEGGPCNSVDLSESRPLPPDLSLYLLYIHTAT